jgi:hypothetical protein
MASAEPTLRVATPDDRIAVDALMKESAAAHFPRTYDAQAAESAVRAYGFQPLEHRDPAAGRSHHRRRGHGQLIEP